MRFHVELVIDLIDDDGESVTLPTQPAWTGAEDDVEGLQHLLDLLLAHLYLRRSEVEQVLEEAEEARLDASARQLPDRRRNAAEL